VEDETPKPAPPAKRTEAEEAAHQRVVAAMYAGPRWIKVTRRDGSVTWMQYDEGM
jgi:hypothetical protein